MGSPVMTGKRMSDAGSENSGGRLALMMIS
jgi:hypothetical protein